MERKTKRQKEGQTTEQTNEKNPEKVFFGSSRPIVAGKTFKDCFFMDGGIILLSIFGIMYVLFGTSLIPKPYQELSYVLPIIMNFVFWCTHSIKVFLEMVLSIRLQYKDF